ncbi:MAG: hypothetical protein Kow0037_16510 [Calditrichia bacterium]
MDGENYIGIIIPAYNPVPETLAELLDRIIRVCSGMPHQILIVDDGSHSPISLPDKIVSHTSLIRHQENLGKGEALKSGFRYFREKTVVNPIFTLDADLQHPPEYIPHFLEQHRRGFSLVIGARNRKPGVMPLHRILSNTITSRMLSMLAGTRILDSQCGYRLIDKRLLGKIHLQETRFHLESEMVVRAAWAGGRIGFVPIPTIYGGEKSAIKNLPDTLNFISLYIKLLKERLFK